MKVFDVIFYYYDRFIRLFEYFEPEFSAMLAVVGHLVTTFVGPLCFLNKSILGWDLKYVIFPIFTIFAVLYWFFYRRYIKSKRYKRIRKEKPMIVNRTVSILIVIVFAVITVASNVIFAELGRNWHQ